MNRHTFNWKAYGIADWENCKPKEHTALNHETWQTESQQGKLKAERADGSQLKAESNSGKRRYKLNVFFWVRGWVILYVNNTKYYRKIFSNNIRKRTQDGRRFSPYS
jgi:hypothetical protein